ncbi:MAG: LPXTG cell wall anchor domain-containing protein [Actinobacteria bacterium]|nr:LPXTG cell wall anchor domain-containing protein [Actinomycetota bacterium]
MINGELVDVDLVQASEGLRRSYGPARTFAEVQALQDLADQMIAAVQDVLGTDATLPILVTKTDTGATISGLVTDPVSGESLAVPVEDVLLILNESLAIMVGGADGEGDPANIAFDGVLEFGEGGYVAVLAYGLTPGAAGEIVVMSTPELIDTFAVDADGGVLTQAQIPSDLAAGEHTVVVAVDGQSASLGFRVLPQGTLPVTGSDSSTTAVLLVLVAVGSLIVLLASRRRQHQA